MIICGVELSGNDAIIVLLKEDQEMFYLPDCRTLRLQCDNPDRTEDLRYFQKTFAKLLDDYQVDQVVIKARMKKGKFSGGANGFKLEAAIQLIPDQNVIIMDNTELKANLKKYPLPIDFQETGLKKYQENAFEVAFAYYGSIHQW